jgi:YggT family protein
VNVASLIELVGTFLYIVILARVILTWFPQVRRDNPLVQIIYAVSEPILAPIRRFIPRSAMIDFSPMIAIFLIIIIQRILVAAFG